MTKSSALLPSFYHTAATRRNLEGWDMWVFTEDGNLVNLDRAFDVLVDQQFGKQVLAYSPAIATYEGHDRYNLTTLCSCDDEEHGKRIIRRLYNAMIHGAPGVEMVALKSDDQLANLSPEMVDEMMEALEALVKASYDITPASEMDELWRRAERVLAKARGEAS